MSIGWLDEAAQRLASIIDEVTKTRHHSKFFLYKEVLRQKRNKFLGRTSLTGSYLNQLLVRRTLSNCVYSRQ